jgi:transposase InsO family protein
VRFAFIQAEKAVFPVAALCRALGVSRPGFYAWQTRPEPTRAREDRGLTVEVAAIHAESRRCYGSPRIHAELRARGRRTSRKRVARLMRGCGLAGRRRRPFRRTTDSNHGLPPARNLLQRQFTATAPNRRWVTDITFIGTGEGWLFLAAILDLFSRRVVGWAVSDRLTTPLPLEALNMALAQRRPRAGLLHHSDQGGQYVSEEYRALLNCHGLVGSMSRRGDCWDNAVAESFFATLKVELVQGTNWPTRAQLKRAIFDYIEFFYNPRRRHSSLGYLSPIAFERQWHRQSRRAV